MFKKIFTLFFFLYGTFIFAQQKYTISGYLTDAESNEQLISANLFNVKTLQGTTTNTYGFYSLTLPKGKVQLKVSYVGYTEQVLEFDLNKDIELNVKLIPSTQLQDLEVTATKAERIEQRTQMSRIDIPIEQIKKIPSLLGEVDVLKALQLLPGVQGGTEGQSGLYVRGGGPDQNLITLDGVPVYNVSHLLGFFSVFNADAIKNVTLYKGGFPARYGGRLSSVIDIQMKEGNGQKLHSEGSIGLVSSKFTIEGPIAKDKASFIVSARRTYVDAFLKPILALSNNNNNQGSSAQTQTVGVKLYFYDLNAKVNYKIDNKNRVYLSAYTGKDVFGSDITQTRTNSSNSISTGTDWGNLTAALRWNHQFSNKLFANTTLTYSRYGFNVGITQTAKHDTVNVTNLVNYNSGIKDLAAKFDLDYVPNPHHYIKTGFNATAHTYNPGATQFQFNTGVGQGVDTILGSSAVKAAEYAVYAEDDIHFGAFRANLGLHASAFAVNGVFYKSLQPRVGLNYLINNDVAVKASFCTMRQYINLLSNEGLGLPSDLWVPSTDRVKPQDAWQVAIGTAKTFQDAFEVSIEAYYKKMTNVLSYSAGQNYLATRDWQDKVVQGNGEAYGLEFLVQKKKGKLTGWVGYTLSWNYRTFADLNGGNPFPYRYDRRHDLEMVASYQLSPTWSLSGSWVFSTGQAFSLSNVKYSRLITDPRRFGGGPNGGNNPTTATVFVDEIAQPSEKNAYRFSPYHRLDIGFEHKRQRKHFESTWTFGAYNVYNRKNPFFLYSAYDETLQKDVYKQVSIFPIIPNVSWGFKF